MAEEKTGAAVRIPPPLVYVAAIVAGGLLDAFVRSLDLGLGVAVRTAGGFASFLLGLVFLAAAARLFGRTGQDPKPWKETPVIVSDGIYRFTRNPMYVGMALMQAGIGLWLSNGWVLALIPVVLVAVYVTAIRHEEVYLERKFGDTYLAYKKSVRRWL